MGMSGRTPYLGPDTYGLEHRDLFFGRNAEGRVIASMLASEPVSILTGPSGSGKSSLLRAQIIPTLAARGWCPIYAHPQDDPIKALREELLAQALPIVADERECVERILAEAGSALDRESSLAGVKDWFKQLSSDDVRRTTLLADASGGKIPHHSLMSLMLADVYTPKQVSDRLTMLAAYSPSGPQPLGDDPTLDALCGTFEVLDEGRRQLLGLLAIEDKSFSETVQAIWSGWAKPLGMLGLVLILDQGEELYTSYGAWRPELNAPLHDWNRREKLFTELTQFAAAAEREPLRFCFSLRPEWYAILRVSLGSLAPQENRSAYFLARFDRDHASEAIECPPKKVGGEVAQEATAFALEGLAKGMDRGEIDPFLLAVTFHLAWHSAVKEQKEPIVITLDHLRKVATDPDGGDEPVTLVDGAMRWLLHQALAQMELGEQYDALEILECLFNEDGSRRILPQNDITRLPLRSCEALTILVDRLEQSGLLRRFSRGNSIFIEVRHERIAATVLRRLETQRAKDSDSEEDRGRFRSFLNRAIALLLNYDVPRLDAHIAAGLEDDPLPAWAGEALRFNRDTVEWDQAAARVFLTSLLHNGPGKPPPSAETEAGAEAEAEAEADAEAEARVSGDSDGLDWAGWRRMVGDFAILAGRRREVDLALIKRSAQDRGRFEQDLLRGIRIDPADAAECLAAMGRRLNKETRVALLRSILAQSQTDDHETETGEIRKWIAKSFGTTAGGR
jgi:hypothetical protein